MSLEYVLAGLNTVESHIKRVQIEAPYAYQHESLEKGRTNFLKWLEIYKLYTKGYQSELGISEIGLRSAIRMLSTFTTEFESQVRNVFEAKISPAAYLFIHDFFKQHCSLPVHFILSEFSDFKQTSFSELISEKLSGMTMPPEHNKAQIEREKDEVKGNDIPVIRYDRAQFDNVLSYPLFLHEAVHYLYGNLDLGSLEKDYSGFDWLTETLIDIYVVNYFGPVYALSLAIYLQKYPHKKSPSHLSYVSRILIALQYLEKAEQQNNLPTPTDQHVKDLREYLNGVWEQHKSEDPADIREQVPRIYKETEEKVRKLMSKRVLPFAEFLSQNNKKRQNAFDTGGFEFVENQTLSIGDVMEYFRAGIPAAADPRIIFNSFISRLSREMIDDAKVRIFIAESVKKWHLKNAWSAAKALSRHESL